MAYLKNKIKLCQRADEYIKELDALMLITERHITRCENSLLDSECDLDAEQSVINAVIANLENSEELKGKLRNEIIGVVDFQDNNKMDSFLPSCSGWRRYIPERLKGNGRWVDVDDQYRDLSYTGATQEDFEFW